MNKKTFLGRKFLSLLSSFVLIFQSFLPAVTLPVFFTPTVYAKDASVGNNVKTSPTATPTTATTAAPTPSPTPIVVQITSTPSPTTTTAATPTSTPVPAETASPTPSPTPDPSATPTSVLTPTPTPVTGSTVTPTPTPSDTGIPTPTATSIQTPTPTPTISTLDITINAAPTTSNESANLDQCGNGPLASPANCTGSAWQNGNLNENQAHYFEGDSIPYRMRFDGMNSGDSHTVTIEWDTTKSGKHALDYLTSFDRTEHTPGNNPCSGVTGCNPGTFTTFAIPSDPQVTGAGVTPVAGVFTLFGGTITAVSSYSYADGTGFTGDKSARLTLTFTSTTANPVLAWGGHISTRADWGLDNAAVNIPGSPYHMRLIDLDGKGGNQDRSLSAAAVIFPGKITILQDATPNGATSFSFTGSPSPLTNFSLIDDGTTANTKLFDNIITFQNYSVNETPIPASWAFDSVSCSVQSANGGSYSTNTTTVTINMKEGEYWSCTYVDHQLNGTLRVIKHVINDNGGTATASDFTMHVKSTGTDVTGSPATGSETGTDYSLAAGAYEVSENTPPTGYVQTGISGDCDTNGNVTVVAGLTKTCTVTNNDVAPTLKLVKIVTNDNGGTAVAGDWTLTATGTGGFSDLGDSNTFHNVNANVQYTLTESGPTGYDASAWSCNGGTQSTNHITLGIGQNVTCTITNNDTAAHLIVIKHVINDNGGTAVAADFSTTISGVSTTNPTALGAESPGVDNVLTAVGSYSVDEGAHAGYAKTLSTDCTGTIALGQTKTCTITNNDIAPTLKLVKVVVNDNGGSAVSGDWVLTASGTGGFNDAGDSTTFHAVSANVQYALSEIGPSGYDAGLWSCDGGTQNGASIQLGLNQNVTCTITNNDQAAHLIVIKHVINDDGGISVAGDFTMSVTGSSPSPSSFAGEESPGTQVAISPGSYSVGETGPSGYSPSYSADCSGSIALGETKTCTVTNNDQAAHLIVIKHVINDNGGTAVASDFSTTITGVTTANPTAPGAESPGVNNTLTSVGSYSVDEGAHTGYTKTLSSDCTGTIAIGQTKTCTITNNDIAPQLIVIKHVINDNGGTAVAGDFTMNVTGTNVSNPSFAGHESPGTTVTLSAGSYSADESTFTGYTKSLSADCSGTIAVGQTKTCTITNNDISPTITIVKDAVPNDAIDFAFGGSLGSFDLDDDAGVVDPPGTDYPRSRTFTNILGNTNLNITETEPNQYWSLQGVTCENTTSHTSFASSLNGATLTVNLPLASDVTCTFTNNKTTNATRTQGFWMTHTAFTSAIFSIGFPSGMLIGSAPHKGTITNIQLPQQSQLFGAYYASISQLSGGKGKNAQRSTVDHTRMVLLQQLVTANLNCAAFGCPSAIQADIVLANIAYYSGNVTDMLTYSGLLDVYNNSGDSIIISPPLPSPGKATPKTSQQYANISFWDAP